MGLVLRNPLEDGVYRNIIGLPSFGTFAPALIGLAFRDVQSRPGIFFFVITAFGLWHFEYARELSETT